jgi:predicted DsbA family dithiol-disulfide isomerase
MGGLIQDWNHFNDPMNSVSRPFQMGPHWMHASHVTQSNIHYQIWHEDPPTSSYPACIAVKCASLQSPIAEELYLEATRSAVMEKGLNVSKIEILLDITRELADAQPEVFSYDQFVQDWNRGAAQAAFRADLQQTSFHKIGRFPTITFTNQTGKGLIITGYRPYEVLVQAMDNMVRKVEPEVK